MKIATLFVLVFQIIYEKEILCTYILHDFIIV